MFLERYRLSLSAGHWRWNAHEGRGRHTTILPISSRVYVVDHVNIVTIGHGLLSYLAYRDRLRSTHYSMPR